MHLDASVLDVRLCVQELVLGNLVAIGHDSLLVCVQGEEVALFLRGQVLVCLSAGNNFAFENGKEWVVLEVHGSIADSG